MQHRTPMRGILSLRVLTDVFIAKSPIRSQLVTKLARLFPNRKDGDDN
jgi:hypothetical protein